METIDVVIFANQNAHDGKQDAVFAWLIAQGLVKKSDATVRYSKGIQAKDGSGRVAMQVVGLAAEFNWSPNAIEQISKSDPDWFTNEV